MKNSIKLIAAAALVATSGLASASILSNTSGDGEFFFAAYDTTSKQTYTFDTAMLLSAVLPTNSVNRSFSLDGFSTFLSTATAATTKWAVLGSDGLAPTALYATGAASTATANPNLTQVSNGIAKIVSIGNTYGNLATVGNHATVADNSWGIVTADNANIASLTGTSVKLPTVFAALTTAEQSFYRYAATSGAAGTKTTFNDGYGQTLWKLDTANNTLSFVTATAPVPEPSTYALAIAGLAVVGALSRRKKAAK